MDSGATGSAVVLEVGAELVVEALDGEWVEDSALEDALDGVLEDPAVDVEDALVVDSLSDAEDIEDSVGLLDVASEVHALD